MFWDNNNINNLYKFNNYFDIVSLLIYFFTILQRYDKQTDNSDYLRLYKQSKQSFDNRQLEALKSLYLWRDKVARDEDESTQSVRKSKIISLLSF